jgi:hypothetical protein
MRPSSARPRRSSSAATSIDIRPDRDPLASSAISRYLHLIINNTTTMTIMMMIIMQ